LLFVKVAILLVLVL